ncbi:hypothetical protein [Chromobacterium haemolyticum]|uniref:hypothetical protein n=1 Tax=Chromobacterium haemolyticum TaxID=394935 RepID=UPI001131B590|nr:hypothetical protein [Chromobacterium haemolyticum]
MRKSHKIQLLIVALFAAYLGAYVYNYRSDLSLECRANIGKMDLPKRRGVSTAIHGFIDVDFPSQSIVFVFDSSDGSHVLRSAHVQIMHNWLGKINKIKIDSATINKSESGTLGDDFNILTPGTFYGVSIQNVDNYVALVRLGLPSLFCEKKPYSK